MKNRLLATLVASVTMLAMAFVANAGQPENDELVFYNATEFEIGGKATKETLTPFDRLPASYEKTTRPELWRHGHHSAGIYVRFRTDSPIIKARWTSLYGAQMSHMAPSGIRGIDLYVLDGGKWYFTGVGRPAKNDKTTEYVLVKNMDRKEREYMIYLSLYDGVTSLEIGIDKSSFIGKPQVDSPRRGCPIVMYGTSILQGGCVSRPGMAHTSLLERALDIEVINLGFSGNALLDLDIARLMASVEKPALYVLDNAPNYSADRINERSEAFFRVIRDAHPDVPVVIVEHPLYPTMRLNNYAREDITARNNAQKAFYEKLRKAGEKRIYYVSADKLLDEMKEGTVDGNHFTDLGVTYYVNAILPTIKKALKASPYPMFRSTSVGFSGSFSYSPQ